MIDRISINKVLWYKKLLFICMGWIIFVIFIMVSVLNIFELMILFNVILCLFFFIVIKDEVNLGNDVLMVIMVSLMMILLMLKKVVILIVFYIRICELIINKIRLIISYRVFVLRLVGLLFSFLLNFFVSVFLLLWRLV